MLDKTLLIKASGEWEIITPENGEKFTLEELQKYVGGYIEYIRLPKKEALVVNEEGTLLGLPLNPMVSAAYGHPIVGDVVYGPAKLL